MAEAQPGSPQAGQQPPADSASTSAPAGGLTPEAHEALCRRCGKCCYRKIIIGRTVAITPFPCEHLDTETSACTVYARRHEVNPRCLSVPEGLKRSAFPADCPYVASFAPEGYQPPLENWSWDGQWDEFDELADDLGVPPEIREKIRARGPDAAPLWAEARDRRGAASAKESR